MTIELNPCVECGSPACSVHPVFHHFICAYVGPSYDFTKSEEGYLCPKCKRTLTVTGNDWEILGDCKFCRNCGSEKML